MKSKTIRKRKDYAMIDDNITINEFEQWLLKSGFRFDMQKTEKMLLKVPGISAFKLNQYWMN